MYAAIGDAVADHRHGGADEQPGRRQHGPRLLAADHAGRRDLRRQQRRPDAGDFQRLQRQSIRNREAQHVVDEQGRVHDRIAGQRLESVRLLHFVLQVLLQEFLQAGQLEAVAQADDLVDLRLAVDAREEPDRPLDFRNVVVEDRAQRLEDGPRIGRLRRVALQVLGLGEAELHFLRQRPREVVAADRDVADPDLRTVRDHEGGVVAPHVEHNRVFIAGVHDLAALDPHLVEAENVVQRQGSRLDDLDLELVVDERPHRVVHLVALHCEQADLGVQQVTALFHAAAQRLEVPDHFFERERNLLPRLVLHDFRETARLDRRQLDEPRQRRVARHRDRDQVVGDFIPGEERLHRVGDDLLRDGVRLAENLGVLDVVEGDRHDLVGGFRVLQLDRLERRLADIDAPGSALLCHATTSIPQTENDCNIIDAGREIRRSQPAKRC